MSRRPTRIPEEGVIDTGKVLIGLRWRRPKRVEIDRDMERLQSALLGNKQRRIADGVVVLTCLAIFVAAVCLMRSLR